MALTSGVQSGRLTQSPLPPGGLSTSRAHIERALSAGSIDAAVVVIEARRAGGASAATVIPIGEKPRPFDRPPPSTAHHDDLLDAQ
jgi:hypothetical protein